MVRAVGPAKGSACSTAAARAESWEATTAMGLGAVLATGWGAPSGLAMVEWLEVELVLMTVML